MCEHNSDPRQCHYTCHNRRAWHCKVQKYHTLKLVKVYFPEVVSTYKPHQQVQTFPPVGLLTDLQP